MNENKVKVKLALGIRRYKEIEVDAKDVPTIQKVNRLIWRESDKEKRSKKQLQDAGITIALWKRWKEAEHLLRTVRNRYWKV